MEESMEREIMWAAWEGPGLEHLRMVEREAEVVADGVILGVAERRPFRLRYQLRCDAAWRVRALQVQSLAQPDRPLELLADGAGRWSGRDGSLERCIDLDISASPFTNTLPIRRLSLEPGESAELSVAYLAVPELWVRPVRQRYTCLEWLPGGGRYRYESVGSDFTAELPVDADGLVLDYPGLFRRVWASP
jgi:hypothetical protein